MFWRIALAVAVGALAYAVTTPPRQPPQRQRKRAMNPITTASMQEDSEMGDPVAYEVMREHLGDKPYAKGDTRKLRSEEAAHLVRMGVLKEKGEKAEPPPANKMEPKPLNKGEPPPAEVKRGPGRPRNPRPDDEDEA